MAGDPSLSKLTHNVCACESITKSQTNNPGGLLGCLGTQDVTKNSILKGYGLANRKKLQEEGRNDGHLVTEWVEIVERIQQLCGLEGIDDQVDLRGGRNIGIW